MKKIPRMKPVSTTTILVALVLVLSTLSICSVRAQSQLSVSLQVSYDSGYTIVTGTVRDAGQTPVEGAGVSVQAVDSSGKAVHFDLVYTDMNGAFTDRFKTPEGVTGEGNIFVSASKLGYDNGIGQTAFTAVPEFSTAFGAIIASIFVMFLILRKRKG